MPVEVSINIPKLKSSIALLDKDLRKAISSGLNDAAFGLRKVWLDLIEEKIDRPTPFTKKVFVNKAKPDNLQSETFIPPIQSEYLRHMIEGEDRKVGDIGSLPKTLLLPTNNVKLDKYGNFKQGPRRFFSTLGKNAFIGKPSEDSNARTAVYEYNKRDGRLKLLAVFQRMTSYKKTLPIEEAAEDYAKQADEILNKKLKEV